jgi:hypothetical protein
VEVEGLCPQKLTIIEEGIEEVMEESDLGLS